MLPILQLLGLVGLMVSADMGIQGKMVAWLWVEFDVIGIVGVNTVNFSQQSFLRDKSSGPTCQESFGTSPIAE